MKQPRKLGEIMREYLLQSNDDFARAFRKLYQDTAPTSSTKKSRQNRRRSNNEPDLENN